MMENKTKIDLKNKSIFITGVAGFIGSNLAKRLLSTVEGVKVVGLDNMNHYYDVRLKEARLNELEKFENFSFVKGKLDLCVGDGADAIELEIFAEPNPPKRVNRPEACGLRHLAFRVENVEATVEELAQMGIECEPIRLDSYTKKKMTFFFDPDGLPLELHE